MLHLLVTNENVSDYPKFNLVHIAITFSACIYTRFSKILLQKIRISTDPFLIIKDVFLLSNINILPLVLFYKGIILNNSLSVQ